MQVESSKYHLRRICVDICNMTESWLYYIRSGRAAMNNFSRLRLHIFESENRLNHLTTERALRAADKQIRMLYDRLTSPIAMMKRILEQLRITRDKTCQFLSCTRMYMDDEILSEFQITPTLRTPQVLEILEFLRSRFDAEWEVKEMVVMALEDMDTAHEMELLVKAWDDCSHAGGEEFTEKLNAYFHTVGGGRLRAQNAQ
ncbi:uncharacterized protein LOC111074009 [Drosophila obscura]|uniref:uncharacterized protein LOC111074009 n=1 Tax=Drosophila obscura TaxID=7282 RepID=UPI001BB2188D|nr:uncharacterized protein LOC111074009 [Drosophila obscura]